MDHGKAQGDSKTYRPNDPQPLSRRILPLAGRIGLRFVLCSVQGGEAMVVGDLLAGRGDLLMDRVPLVAGPAADERPRGGPAPAGGVDPRMGLFLRTPMGLRGPDLWPDD